MSKQHVTTRQILTAIFVCGLVTTNGCEFSSESEPEDADPAVEGARLATPEGSSCPMGFTDEVPPEVDKMLRERFRPTGETSQSTYVDEEGRAVHVSSATLVDDSTGTKTVVSCHGACGDQDCSSYSGCQIDSSGYSCTACSCGWWCDGCFCTRSVAVINTQGAATMGGN